MPPKVLLAAQPETYDQQIGEKRKRIETMFAKFDIPQLEVYESERQNYRMRSEFRVWHEGNQCHYIMFDKGEAQAAKRIKVTQFSVGSVLLNELMAAVMDHVIPRDILKQKLYQVNFHTTLSGEAMVTLIYHKQLNEEWRTAALDLRSVLSSCPSCPNGIVSVIGRSKKQKVDLDRSYVDEVMTVDFKQYSYRQVEGAFSQPNGGTCQHMLAWAQKATKGSTTDLLELYCGNGNFTVALAENFRNVIATEVSKASVAVAQHNLTSNAITNASVFRVSSEEFTEAWRGVRQLHRLRSVDFSTLKLDTLLIDPPRAGLDDESVQLLKEFKNIVYISCNPDTLHDNLQNVADTHKIKRFALFDQFPYTEHIECGVFLQRAALADLPEIEKLQQASSDQEQIVSRS